MAVIQRGSLDEVLGVVPPHGGNVLVVHLEQIQATLISRKILSIILLIMFYTCCVSSSVKHFSSFAGHSRARRERERHRRDLEIKYYLLEIPIWESRILIHLMALVMSSPSSSAASLRSWISSQARSESL